ncbi:hypothetical protein HDU93_000799 [Gonapodya sp. JEL0774]|nr:hypothetical protein HDU93_000799 [Gonapodya sp. JEL0774]
MSTASFTKPPLYDSLNVTAPYIKGYAWPHSVQAGESFSLHVSSPISTIEVKIVLHDGSPHGRNLFTKVVRGVGDHPIPNFAPEKGCEWPASAQIETQETWPSGWYDILLNPVYEKGALDIVGQAWEHSRAFVVVRGSSNSKANILLELSTNTYNAYNDFGGRNLYTGAVRASFLRPMAPGLLFKPSGPGNRVAHLDATGSDLNHRKHVRYLRSGNMTPWGGSSGWTNYERDFLSWLYKQVGSDAVDVCVNADLELHGDAVLAGKKLVLSVGHDEYWSKGMRDSIESFIARGGNVAFFSGNTSYWQVRLSEGDGGATMTCYKGQFASDPMYASPHTRHLTTSIWSDHEIKRPENTMTGVSFSRGGYARIRKRVPRGSGGYTVYQPSHWLFNGTSLTYGDVMGSNSTIVGYECDGCAMTIDPASGLPVPTGEDGTPRNFQILAMSPASPFDRLDASRPVPDDVLSEVEFNAFRVLGDYGPASVRKLSYGTAVLGSWVDESSGGTVVTSGCTDWACGVRNKANICEGLAPKLREDARSPARREAHRQLSNIRSDSSTAALMVTSTQSLQLPGGIRVCIDRGGTFTDAIGFIPDDNEPSGFRHIVLKVLSVDPAYPDAPTEAIRRILSIATGTNIPRGVPIPSHNLSLVRMGTTVATNALLERRGEPCALLITRGFKDLLRIGNQSRPAIFDLQVRTPDVLYERVVEVDERVTLVGYTCSPLGAQKEAAAAESADPALHRGITGELVRVLKTPDLTSLRTDLAEVRKAGIKSVAVALMHSYAFPDHEQQVADVCREVGFENISISSNVMPMIKIVPRATSSTVDSYLTPPILRYISTFSAGFDTGISSAGAGPRVEFMQSDGGLVPVRSFGGLRGILSGPAGGVVGYAMTSFDEVEGSPVIGFDMGGTSTDVSRYAGRYEHVFETTTAGVTIQAPQLDINTVAAGGGSRLFFRSGLFVVGPESASAHPGPACYRKGGPLAITDANLHLGRLLPQYFPHIFGKTEDQPLDSLASAALFEELTLEINSFQRGNGLREMSSEEVAYGFVKLVLGERGLSLADVVHEVQEPAQTALSKETLPQIRERAEQLAMRCFSKLAEEGFAKETVETQIFLNLRYQGTDTALMTLKPKNGWAFDEAFVTQYRTEFGFVLSRPIIVDDIRVRGIGHSPFSRLDSVYHTLAQLKLRVVTNPSTTSSVYWETLGRVKTPVFELSKLSSGDVVQGPAIVVEPNSVIIVEEECRAIVTRDTVVIEVGEQRKNKLDTTLDPIQLSIFSHRFMSIAEQMGHTLQRTSVSTNIKERLDFSCALFGPDGGLVSNAPHIPVHLGSMQEAVKFQLNYWSGRLVEGDVLVSNHPMAGGSHLPDITVITPVFSEDKIVFFTASRGHHADIGGLQPGSLPPFSKELYQEGAAIRSFKLVENGVFQEEGIVRLLAEEPAKFPGCSGTRTLKDNLSDLKAQIAANQRGIILVKTLIAEYGLDVVQSYMTYIRENAELAVRDLLMEMYERHGNRTLLEAEDFMDDGSPIKLTVKIDPESRSAIFDFTGTGPEVYGNTNVAKDIPLNQGCLAPIQFVIPEGSILDPSETAAVVGGNVLTSQRLVDVILKAFGACAASQGCMNNLTFGTEEKVVGKGNSYGYYETICGGAGAGPSWDGKSGVHTHMTNTRITDAEILERRYPVLVHEFGLRPHSGGLGAYSGGDGCVRELEFLEPVQVSILSERRVVAPYGLAGGESGARGRNVLIKKESNGSVRRVYLSGKNTISVNSGDRLRIETPGGGGFGPPGSSRASPKQPTIPLSKAGGSVLQRIDNQISV